MVHERGVIVEANPALARMFGYDMEELTGMYGAQLATPETWARIEAASARGPEHSLEGVGLRKDGSIFNAQVVCKPYNLEGRDLRIAVFRDVTDLRRAEEGRRESEARYRILFNSMLDGFMLVEAIGAGTKRPLDYRVIEVNPSFEKLTGLAAERIAGRSLRKLRTDLGEPWLALLDEVAETGEASRVERYSEALGKHLEISAFSAEPGLIATLVTDVTERKELEARLRQAAKLEAIGTLASGVAHEINNPINVVMNYASLIQRKGISRENIESFAGEIIKESERVATIVRNLLAFSRQELEMPVSAELPDIIDETLSLTRKILRNDQITLEIDIAEGTDQIEGFELYS